MHRLTRLLKGLLLGTPSAAESLTTHHLFHRLWTNAVGKKGYDKDAWLRLERELFSSPPRAVSANVDAALKAAAYPPTNGFAHSLSAFEKDLVALINKHGQEYGSRTADFILARYLRRCLEAFNEASFMKNQASREK